MIRVLKELSECKSVTVSEWSLVSSAFNTESKISRILSGVWWSLTGSLVLCRCWSQVSDKRVSRHHGLLQNLNGQLSLKPVRL